MNFKRTLNQSFEKMVGDDCMDLIHKYVYKMEHKEKMNKVNKEFNKTIKIYPGNNDEETIIWIHDKNNRLKRKTSYEYSFFYKDLEIDTFIYSYINNKSNTIKKEIYKQDNLY
jgi:hypothetical protein